MHCKLLEHGYEIGLRLPYRQNRVGRKTLHALDGVSDRECLRVELGVYLAPEQRHRNGRTGERAGTERCNDGLSVTILQIIEIDFVAALGHVTRDGSNVFQLTQDASCEQLAEHA